ncbi:MAG: cytochrome c [Terracidiphilus sp.]|jgi:mono/diheme cytochrome c family protein
MLKPLLFVSAVVFFGITVSSASAPTPQEAAQATASGQKNPLKPSPQSQARAKQIYQMDCSFCHGDNGNGKTDLAHDMALNLGDWTDPKTLADKQDQELFNVIRNGKGKMPAEAEGRAKDHEVWSLILYVRGLAKATPSAAPVADPVPAASAPASTN